MHLISLAKYKGGTPSVGMTQNNRSIQNMAGLKHAPTLNLAVDRFYQAEPELRQGKGELFLRKGYKAEQNF